MKRAPSPKIVAVAITVAVAILLGGLYLIAASRKRAAAPSGPTACTLEAKVCPDGSYVGRTGPDCAFAPCPGETPPEPDTEEGGSETDRDTLALRLSSELTTRGVAYLGAHPIEGFDAGLLLAAFPGLTEADFDGAAAVGGSYGFRGGKLAFDRDESRFATSADGTLVTDGYATLLSRLSERLDIAVMSEEDVLLVVTAIE